MTNNYWQNRQNRLAKGSPKITKNMADYLLILLNDCGFGSLVQRNGYLSNKYGREIRFIDELTYGEGHALIEELKERRSESIYSQGDDEDDHF